MAFNNNNRGGYGGGYGGGYSRGGYSNNRPSSRSRSGYGAAGRGGYGGSYGNDRAYDTRVPYKRSSCNKARTKDGDMYLYGWKKTRSGKMLSFSAFPPSQDGNKDRDGRIIRGETQNGRKFERWLVKFRTDEFHPEQLMSGMYWPDKGILVIDKIGMVANPNAPTGITATGKKVSGYFGTYKR